MLNVNPGSYLRTLALLHYSLFIGMVLFGVFAYYQNGSFTAQINNKDFFVYSVPVFAACGYFVGQFLFNKQLQQIAQKDSISTKFRKYQSALLIKYALVEGPCLFALVAYYIDGSALYLVTAIALMAYFFAQKPTKTKLLKDVPFDLEEQKQINTLNNS
jgi:hypothetical protein